MLKRIAAIVSAIAFTVPIMEPANASPRQTRVIAQMNCGEYSKTMVLNPEYYGQTRSGLDIWICAESGPSRQVFAMYDPGPYAVIVCSMMECKIIDWTY